MDNYDEDLSENYWFSILATQHKRLYDKAASERSVICVPKIDSWTKETQTILSGNKEIFESHILKECEDSSETELDHPQSPVRWLTYNKKAVFIDGNKITCSKDFSSEEHSAVILFEENFFNDEDKSYKVICISCPLLANLASEESQQHDMKLALPVIKTKRLFHIAENVSNLRRLQSLMDHLISMHLKNVENRNMKALNRINSQGNMNIELDEMHALKNCLKSVTDLCNNCMQILMKDFKLKKATEKNTQLLSIVRTEVELYVYYEIYGSVFRQICSYVADEEAKFNKTTQNIRNISPADVGISEDFWLSLPKAKRVLQRINRYFTVQEKLNCIKEACMCITSNKEMALSSDDLLPILIYLIIKCNIPNWLSNKVFIKNFNMLPNVMEQYGFYLCTFEAAIQHIKSGSVDKKKTPTLHDMPSTTSDPFEDLSEAISKGDVALLKQRLEQSAKLKSMQDRKLCHPLCYCQKCSEIRKSDSKQISTQITPKTKNDKGQTLLHIAAENGHHEIVEFLLKFGFSVNETDYHGSSPLHVAAAAGAQSAMFLLLYHGANATAIDNNSNTALHLCCQNGHDACVKALLFFDPTSTAVNVNAPNDGGDTPLHIAAKWGYEEIVNVLMEYGANINATNRQKKTPIDVSHNTRVTRSLQNSANMVQLVLDLRHLQHENKNKSTGSMTVPRSDKSRLRDSSNSSSSLVSPSTREKKIDHAYAVKQVEKLFKAVTDNDINMVKFLCGWNNKKSNGEKSTQAKCHPLCQCSKCQPNSHEHILHANSSNSENYCGLIIAAMHGYADMARIFLDHGADLNTTTKLHKYSALHFAAKSGNFEILDLLLSRGCKVDIRDDCGNTPLFMCCIYNHVNCADKLISFGASVNIRNRVGESPLHLAVKWKNKNLIELLVENGGMAYYKNHDGITPVDMSNSNPEIKEVLLKSIVKRERSESELEWDIAPEQSSFQTDETDMADDEKTLVPEPIPAIVPQSESLPDKVNLTTEHFNEDTKSTEDVVNEMIDKISNELLESVDEAPLLQSQDSVEGSQATNPLLSEATHMNTAQVENNNLDVASSPYFELGSKPTHDDNHLNESISSDPQDSQDVENTVTDSYLNITS